jgi:tetratricopeptide (TPR) repeat protein
LKATWQKQVLASIGYRELGMFEDAAQALEEIEPEDKTRNEVLYARVDIYLAAKKWDMAAAVARHLVKVDPGNPGAWINLAYSVRRTESIEQAEAILLKARALHPKSALIAFNLACYASVTRQPFALPVRRTFCFTRSMPRPICFMVMPYRTKETRANPPAPPKVNFDTLWEKAFLPVIEELGYQPVRADQDLGALIIQEMIERLYFSDLVVADLTIPNGNVYYEIGIRHAARNSGCVLVGADWSEPLFDVDQMRQIRYPLSEEEITDATAVKIRQILTAAVPQLAHGVTPMFQILPGYPAAVQQDRASSIKDFLEQLSAFQAEMQAVRHAPKAERRDRVLAVCDKYAARQPVVPAVALEIMYLLRDYAEWQDALAFIDGLPQPIRALPVVHEQRCLVQSKTGNHLEAIGALEELIKTSGATSEREGLLGGRYKKLYASATDPADKARYLNLAIKHYENGMKLDLNDYYPTCNLPRLYLARGKRGDEDRARAAAEVARIACERARERNPNDEWVRPTLLGMAFDAGDVTAAEELADQVLEEGAARWKLDTTINDLEFAISHANDAETQRGLQRILDQLKKLL